MSGEFDSRKEQNLNEGLEYSELCDSKLSGLHAFDYTAIID